MNKIILYSAILAMLTCCSCKSREEKAKDVVNEFLTEINNPTKTLNKILITNSYDDFLTKQSAFYASEKWELTAKPENDSALMVEAKGHTHNSEGQPIEVMQKFALSSTSGQWKIFDSYNLFINDYDFQVADTKWEFYWDVEKVIILNALKDQLKLEIIEPGHHGSYFNQLVQGKIKFVNNSDYDVTDMKILIEHYDKDGNSVNTDHEYITDIVRSHGYRELDWSTTNCSSCNSQKYAISFIKESK